MPDQLQKPRPQTLPPESGPGGGGPSAPKSERPDVSDLLKKMRKVDPDQAKRYRQRTGE
ncbi:ubiquitin-like protein UBact [Verrucomicrobia bacterium LW23]|nr:ubiquitin-like protein UBact [Verrucomicrobia bacterium LW23]